MKRLSVFLSFLLLTLAGFSQGYKVGDVATDFKLLNVDGKYVSMANFPEAKGFIIVFTCNHCPFSVAYEDRLIELHNKFAPKGFPVIAINPNDPAVEPRDSYELMKVRAKEKGFPFPYLFDDGQKVYPVYGATHTPHVYLLERVGGQLKVAYIGGIDDSPRDPAQVQEKYLANAVKALLDGKRPEPSVTRAIGCTIKRKAN